MRYLREREYRQVSRHVASGASCINLVGGIGSGKTTLLKRLREKFTQVSSVHFCDDWEAQTWRSRLQGVHIVSTQRALRAPDVCIVRLDPLPTANARAWLVWRVHELGGREVEVPEVLLRTLGGVPLFLERAAVCLLSASPTHLVENIKQIACDPHVQEAVLRTFQSLSTTQRAAFALLCAFAGNAQLDEVAEVDALLDAGLVTCSKEKLTVSPIVQIIVREALTSQQWGKAIAAHTQIILARKHTDERELVGVLDRTKEHRQLSSIAFAAARRLGDRQALSKLVTQVKVPPAMRTEVLLTLARSEVDTTKAYAFLELAASLVPSARRDLRASVLIEEGFVSQRRGDVQRAQEVYQCILQQTKLPREVHARAELNLGTLCHDALRFDEARELYERALAGSEPRVEGGAWLNLGVLHQEEGDVVRAQRYLSRATTAFVRGGDLRLQAIALTSLGAVLHEQGDPKDALTHHMQARVLLEARTDEASAGLVLVRMALALASLGRIAEAEHELASSEMCLLKQGDVALRRVLQLAAAFVALHAGTLSDVDGLMDVRNAPGAHTASTFGDDVRFLLRLLRAEMQRRSIPLRTLLLDREQRTITTENGTQYALGAQVSAWRIVVALYEAGDKRLSAEDLWRAGWPNERAIDGAWQNRVYVALSVLRSKGLRNHLVRDERGYGLNLRPQGPLTHARGPRSR